MEVIVAPDNREIEDSKVKVFLAGGITDCWDWQQEVIKELEKFDDTDYLVVFNPRRENFPMDDPNAAREQIEWEFNRLHSSEIFSMYFAKSNSVQPICMYELGAHLTRAFYSRYPRAVLVSVEKGYSREQDVAIQVDLVIKGSSYDIPVDIEWVSSDFEGMPVNLDATPEQHAKIIHATYLELCRRNATCNECSSENN